MTTILWRILDQKHEATPFASLASLAPGEWNLQGTDVIYASSSKASGILTALAHREPHSAFGHVSPWGASATALVPELRAYPIIVPDSVSRTRVELDILPKSWPTLKTIDASRLIGNRFVEDKSAAILFVPNQVYGEYDALINPGHPDFHRILPGRMESIFSNEIPLLKSSISNATQHRDVFISHSSKDKKQIVSPLYRSLFSLGLSSWYDEAEIRWGDSITEKINLGLTTSDFVLIVLSENFLSSSFAKGELAAALNRDLSTGQSRLLPLLVGDSNFRGKAFESFPLMRDRLYQRWDDNPDEIALALQAVLRRNP